MKNKLTKPKHTKEKLWLKGLGLSGSQVDYIENNVEMEKRKAYSKGYQDACKDCVDITGCEECLENVNIEESLTRESFDEHLESWK